MAFKTQEQINKSMERKIKTDVDLSTITDEGMAIIEAVKQRKNILITGGGGVGKTYLNNKIKQLFSHVYMTATTGIAAMHIGGVTIHNLFCLGIMGKDDQPFNSADKINFSPWAQDARDCIANDGIVIIDEVSMFSSKSISYLDETLRFAVGRGVRDPRPFGGLQIIFSGDFYQLPPVIKPDPEELFPTPDGYAFESQAWKAAGIEVHMLTKTFRQEDQSFANCLSRVRNNTLTSEDIELLKSRNYSSVDTSQVRYVEDATIPTFIFSTNREKDAFNIQILSSINAPLRRFICQDAVLDPTLSDKAVAKFMAQLDNNCLAPKLLDLKVGAQVMLLKNLNFSKGLVNGACGKIITFKVYDFSSDPILKNDDETDDEYNIRVQEIRNASEQNKDVLYLPVVRFDNGYETIIHKETWKIKQSQFHDLVSRTQFPLCLAYALTSHKTQGMTIPSAYCNFNKIFAPGQAYVMLSRVKNLDGLYITGFHPSKIISDESVVEFYKNNVVEK